MFNPFAGGGGSGLAPNNTYDAESEEAISGKGVADAISGLDVDDTEETGKYVSAVSEADGKIIVTRASLPTAKNTYDAESEEAISGKGVKDAIDGIPSPMIFKAVANSASDLETPIASGANKNVGWTYKVGTAFKYGDIDCKTGDILICDGTKYEYVPSANEDNVIETIKVEGEPLTVGADKSVNITKSNLGLSNVGNFKAVSTVASQGLTDTEKSNARTNIGAGTVTKVKVGSSGTEYSPTSGVVTIPAYPTSLPANGGTAANVSGTVAVANGGTGATTAANARTNLGLGAVAVKGVETTITATDNNVPTSNAVKKELDKKADKTELSSAIDGVKTNILSTVVASSNASASNSKTLEFQGTGKNLEKLVIEGKTVQDGTPSPSAPVEVKGVGDKCNNIFDYAKWSDTWSTVQSGTVSKDASGFTLTATANDCYTKTYNVIACLIPGYTVGKTYTLSWKANVSIGGNVFIFDNVGNVIKNGNNSSTKSITFTATTTSIQIRFGVAASGASIRYYDIKIEEGSTATKFYPYDKLNMYEIPISVAGKTSNIYLDEPLFDGEILDTESGSVDKIKKLFTLTGDEAWTLQSTNSYGIANFKIKLPVNATSNGGAICSNHFVRQTTVITDTKTPGVTISNNTDLYIRLQSSEVATVDAMKAWLKANPTYVIYGINATKETFEAPEIATTVGKNTLSVDTEVTPAKLEATSFGEYYSKAQIDKMLNGEWVDVDVSNVVPRDTAAGYSVDLTGNNRIRFKKINNIIYVDIQLKISCTDPNVVSIYFKNVVPQQFFSNTAKVLPSRMSNWVNINDNYRGLAWFQVDPNTNAISISLADNKKMVTANGMVFTCYSNYFAD